MALLLTQQFSGHIIDSEEQYFVLPLPGVLPLPCQRLDSDRSGFLLFQIHPDRTQQHSSAYLFYGSRWNRLQFRWLDQALQCPRFHCHKLPGQNLSQSLIRNLSVSPLSFRSSSMAEIINPYPSTPFIVPPPLNFAFEPAITSQS